MNAKKKPRNLLKFLLSQVDRNKKKQEGNTTQIVYDKIKWTEFKHILDYEGTNTSRFFWGVVEAILGEYDQKEHSLDKYLGEIELLTPTLDTDSLKVLKYLRTLSMDKVKELEEKVLRDYIYIKAITNGEIELDDFPYLWRKYR